MQTSISSAKEREDIERKYQCDHLFRARTSARDKNVAWLQPHQATSRKFMNFSSLRLQSLHRCLRSVCGKQPHNRQHRRFCTAASTMGQLEQPPQVPDAAPAELETKRQLRQQIKKQLKALSSDNMHQQSEGHANTMPSWQHCCACMHLPQHCRSPGLPCTGRYINDGMFQKLNAQLQQKGSFSQFLASKHI